MSFYSVVMGVVMLVAVLLPAQSQEQEVERITVIGATPVQSDDFTAGDFFGRAQSVDSETLENSGSFDITHYFNRHFSGVHINSTQGNPLQPDLYYRGFAASPLLGLPNGLTVYQNGVRLNEPLGDSINWDLLPMNAVNGISLISGANALYGLNTLGGAVVLRMKDGFTYSGHALEIESGAYGRFIGNLESGGNNGRFGYYVNAQRFYEQGWRDLSQSWAEHIYGSFDWHGEGTVMSVNYHRAMSNLRGNGLSPVGLLAIDRNAIFTAPDITANSMYMWVISGEHDLTDTVQLAGNLYYRKIGTDSFNGDAAEREDDAGMEESCEFSGIDRTVEVDCGRLAINNISTRDQEALGGVFEIDLPLHWFGLKHDVDMGAGYYEGRAYFNAQVQNALLGDNRSTVGPGSARGEFVEDEATRVKTRTENLYLYAGNTISINDLWTAGLSGYYHNSTVKLRDLSGMQPELNGEHDFNNLNWSVSLIYHWNPLIDIYAGYSESSRLPTPIELACNEATFAMAGNDEDAECRLPNAFVADPPLEEVTAKSFELGARGNMADDWQWSIGAFHTRNRDDIIFQTTGRAQGLFKNVDETQRIGIEASLSGSMGKLEVALSYTRIEATFEDDFLVLSPNHPNADEAGEIQVEKGDTIPGIPEDQFKLAVDYAFTERFSAGMDMIALSGSYMRGDEANEMDKVSGYAVFNAHARYRMNNAAEIFMSVENLFDREYENFGLVGEEPGEVFGLERLLGESSEDPGFVAPGAPLLVWAGVRMRF